MKLLFKTQVNVFRTLDQLRLPMAAPIWATKKEKETILAHLSDMQALNNLWHCRGPFKIHIFFWATTFQKSFLLRATQSHHKGVGGGVAARFADMMYNLAWLHPASNQSTCKRWEWFWSLETFPQIHFTETWTFSVTAALPSYCTWMLLWVHLYGSNSMRISSSSFLAKGMKIG